MQIQVPFLPKSTIEREAERLSVEFFRRLGRPIQAPIVVEDILEGHLGLSLDFDDLETVLGVPDVLGALWVNRRGVFIDERLDPVAHPDQEGRYFNPSRTSRVSRRIASPSWVSFPLGASTVRSNLRSWVVDQSFEVLYGCCECQGDAPIPRC